MRHVAKITNKQTFLPEIDRGGVLVSLYRSVGAGLGKFFGQAPCDPSPGRINRSRRGEPIRVGIFLGSGGKKNRPSAGPLLCHPRTQRLVEETLTHFASAALCADAASLCSTHGTAGSLDLDEEKRSASELFTEVAAKNLVLDNATAL